MFELKDYKKFVKVWRVRKELIKSELLDKAIKSYEANLITKQALHSEILQIKDIDG